MNLESKQVPFEERAGRVRGVLDLVTGCYPAYLFGGPVGRQLPIFHLHEVTPEQLEPALRYLAENNYRTVTADEVFAFVTRGVSLGRRAVALTFDDAWASLWTVALPLLRRYGLKAISFAIPARITEAPVVRPTLDDGLPSPGDVDRSSTPFVTWPELRALHDSGLVDVQSHSLTHGFIYCSSRPVGFVTPAFASEPILALPLVSPDGDPPQFLAPASLGAPLYVRRSRLSDARRFVPREDLVAQATAYVEERGGAEFFTRPEWRRDLERALTGPHGAFETEQEHRHSIENELERSRGALEERLGPCSVRHIALPWGVAGRVTRQALQRSGYDTAFAEGLFRRHSVRPGDNVLSLGRLNAKFLRCLPGNGRRFFLSVA